jgi:hypothetical protein
MPRNPLLLALTLAFLVLAGPTALAQESDLQSTTRTRVEAALEEYREQLHLTDYQWTQVRLIIKSDIRERMAIAQRYGLDGDGEGIDQLSSKELRRLKRDMKNSRKATEERMERYLDKDQMKAFEAIHEQLHDELMAQLEARQG